MNKTRVVFFAEILIEDYDGATRTMFQLIRRIPSERFEFLFICGVGAPQVGGFECLRVPSVTLPINANYKMAIPALPQRKLRSQLDAFAPDVVHIATPSLLGAYGVEYARSRQLPVLTIYHTHFISYIDYYLKHLPFLIGPVKKKVISGQLQFYNQCDKIYVPATSIAEELRELGVSQERMTIWKRGIDRGLFSPAKKNRDILRGITGNDYPCILFASRLVWEKNLETLFAVYDHLQNSGVKCNLVIAGDGLAAPACRQRMPKAFFTGKADHGLLSVLYASSSVFLFPSVSETCGNVVLEAMASGLPCVVADGGGSRDFITHNENGFRCAPLDAADFSARALQLIRDKELASRFSDESLLRSTSYQWEELAGRYFEDLEELSTVSEIVPAVRTAS